VQSLSTQNKYKKLFSPIDFDLLIADESHRVIGENTRAVFEYFIGKLHTVLCQITLSCLKLK
jgi:type I restriction enzyme R subunit